MKKDIEKYIDLSGLPRKYNHIDWINSVGYTLKFKYDDIDGVIEIVKYNGNSSLSVKYNNEIYLLKTSTIVNCSFGRMLKRITRDFRFDIGSTFIDDNRNIVITDRFLKKGRYGRLFKYYSYKCNICNWTSGEVEEHNLLHGSGCVCCSGRFVVEGINDIPTTAPWMIKYFQGGVEEAKLYTKKSGQTIIPICPYCKKIHNKPVRIITLFKNHGFACECVSDKISYPEKFLMCFLKENNIDYIFQFSKTNAEWVGKYKYDFYLNKYNTIIEVNGGQHYRKSHFKISLEEQKRKDILKKELAINNKIKFYIELNCSKSNVEYISNSILESGLLDILQLNQDIDWNKCDYFAQSNLIKDVCDYYMHNDKNIFNIATHFNLHYSTICRYLKKGSKFNWCDYKITKKVEVLDKYGVSIAVFNSANDIVKNTNYAKNVYAINRVCRGLSKKGMHNGYIFKYV